MAKHDTYAKTGMVGTSDESIGKATDRAIETASWTLGYEPR